MNLIGDIQGNYRTLLALLKQMPDDDPVSVGDMIDRGRAPWKCLSFSGITGRRCWDITSI